MNYYVGILIPIQCIYKTAKVLSHCKTLHSCVLCVREMCYIIPRVIAVVMCYLNVLQLAENME